MFKKIFSLLTLTLSLKAATLTPTYDTTTRLVSPTNLVVSGASATNGFRVYGVLTNTGLTASTVPYIGSNKEFVSSIITPTELSYLSGLSGNIQDQIDNIVIGTAPAVTQGPNLVQKNIVLDTDIGGDIDDVFDLATINALVDNQEIKVLGITHPQETTYGAPAIEVINRLYGHGYFPIGVTKDALGLASDTYNAYLATNYENYLLKSTNAVNAVTLLRKVLSEQSETNVTLVTVGQLRNLYNLYNSAPDSYSTLTGAELITSKLKEIVVVAGIWPVGSEYNFYSDVLAAQVLNSLTNTVPIRYAGIELGDTIFSGSTILTKPINNPVRAAANLYYTTYSVTNRPAWGQVGILYAARGLVWRGQTNFSESAAGWGVIAASGSNSFTINSSGNHKYLSKVASDATLQANIETLVNQTPIESAFAVMRNGDNNITGNLATTGTIGINSTDAASVVVQTNGFRYDSLRGQLQFGQPGAFSTFTTLLSNTVTRAMIVGSNAPAGITSESFLQMIGPLNPSTRFPTRAEFKLGSYAIPGGSFSPMSELTIGLSGTLGAQYDGTEVYTTALKLRDNGDILPQNRIIASATNTAAYPTYTWSDRLTTGLMPTANAGVDEFGIAIGGSELMRLFVNGMAYATNTGPTFVLGALGTSISSRLVVDNEANGVRVLDGGSVLSALRTANIKLGTPGATAGEANFYNASNTNRFKLKAGVTGADWVFTLPIDAPVAGDVLSVNAVSAPNVTLEWVPQSGGGGGGTVGTVINTATTIASSIPTLGTDKTNVTPSNITISGLTNLFAGSLTASNVTATTILMANASKQIISATNSGNGSVAMTISPALTTPTIDGTTSATLRTGSFGITIDGGGSAITTGVKGYISIPYACTIQSVTMLADQSGSAVVDIWKDTYANYPPTVADTLIGGGGTKPTITTANKSTDSTLTGWTTSVSAGDTIGFNVDSASTITRLTLILKVLK